VGLILDSSVAIAAERRGDTVQALLKRAIDAAGDQEAALSTFAFGGTTWHQARERRRASRS
jgi:hypothetical protein